MFSQEPQCYPGGMLGSRWQIGKREVTELEWTTFLLIDNLAFSTGRAGRWVEKLLKTTDHIEVLLMVELSITWHKEDSKWVLEGNKSRFACCPLLLWEVSKFKQESMWSPYQWVTLASSAHLVSLGQRCLSERGITEDERTGTRPIPDLATTSWDLRVGHHQPGLLSPL